MIIDDSKKEKRKQKEKYCHTVNLPVGLGHPHISLRRSSRSGKFTGASKKICNFCFLLSLPFQQTNKPTRTRTSCDIFQTVTYCTHLVIWVWSQYSSRGRNSGDPRERCPRGLEKSTQLLQQPHSDSNAYLKRSWKTKKSGYG